MPKSNWRLVNWILIRSKVIAGTLSFNEAATKYSDDESAKYAGPFLLNRDGSPYVTIDQMDKEMVAMIGKMKVGDFSQPTPFTGEQGKKVSGLFI